LFSGQSSSIVSSIDLLPVVADLTVINRLNGNHIGIVSDDAVKIHRMFRHKPINVEHETDQIVGHVFNTAFSYESPPAFTDDFEKFLGVQEEFYLSFGGVIYAKYFPV
jgi:hypothetical protein